MAVKFVCKLNSWLRLPYVGTADIINARGSSVTIQAVRFLRMTTSGYDKPTKLDICDRRVLLEGRVSLYNALTR
jgi:hypothetical protein